MSCCTSQCDEERNVYAIDEWTVQQQAQWGEQCDVEDCAEDQRMGPASDRGFLKDDPEGLDEKIECGQSISAARRDRDDQIVNDAREDERREGCADDADAAMQGAEDQ